MAFRKLKILLESEGHVPLMVHRLSLIPLGEKGTPPIRFRAKGQKAVRKELDDIAGLASKLASALDGLCEPSIVALADNGFLQLFKHLDLSTGLRKLSDIARSADLAAVAAKGDRKPKNNLAAGIANILAHDYETLTGKIPTLVTPTDTRERKHSPFITLVGDIFAALGIDAKPEGYAKEAKEKFAARKNQ